MKLMRKRWDQGGGEILQNESSSGNLKDGYLYTIFDVFPISFYMLYYLNFQTQYVLLTEMKSAKNNLHIICKSVIG